MEFKHYSVLRDETIENLNIRPDETIRLKSQKRNMVL